MAYGSEVRTGVGQRRVSIRALAVSGIEAIRASGVDLEPSLSTSLIR